MIGSDHLISTAKLQEQILIVSLPDDKLRSDSLNPGWEIHLLDIPILSPTEVFRHYLHHPMQPSKATCNLVIHPRDPLSEQYHSGLCLLEQVPHRIHFGNFNISSPQNLFSAPHMGHMNPITASGSGVGAPQYSVIPCLSRITRSSGRSDITIPAPHPEHLSISYGHLGLSFQQSDEERSHPLHRSYSFCCVMLITIPSDSSTT